MNSGSAAPKQRFTEDQVIHKSSRVIWNAKCSSFVKGNVAEADDDTGKTPRTSRRLMGIRSRDQLRHIPPGLR